MSKATERDFTATREWAARNAEPVEQPEPSEQGRCAFCGRPTQRFVLDKWACNWCDDLPGKEAL